VDSALNEQGSEIRLYLVVTGVSSEDVGRRRVMSRRQLYLRIEPTEGGLSPSKSLAAHSSY